MATFTFESKYNVGDTVYTIVNYTDPTHGVRMREIAEIKGFGFSGAIEYKLVPFNNRPSELFDRAIERNLYATVEEAHKVARAKRKLIKNAKRERLYQEIADAKLNAENDINEIKASLKYTVERLERELKELK